MKKLALGIVAAAGLAIGTFSAAAGEAAHPVELARAAPTISNPALNADLSAELGEALALDLQPAERIGTDSIADYWMSIGSDEDVICLTAQLHTETGTGGTTCQNPFEFQRLGLQIRVEESGTGTVAHLFPTSVAAADINALTNKIEGYVAPKSAVPQLLAVDTATADEIGRLILSRDIGDVIVFDPMTEP